MNKKFILLGILTASALAVYSINRRYSPKNKPITSGGKIPNSSNQGQPKGSGGNQGGNIPPEKDKTAPPPTPVCREGFVLMALDPSKPKIKICVPNPNQDTKMPIKCPFGQKLVDGICKKDSTDDTFGGGGFGGNPPKIQDERTPTNQTRDVYTTLTFDENSANRY
jgi:hypothetical protein